ncbi:MAG: nuclear transport factor 2 family protein [Polyangiales bacterium]
MSATEIGNKLVAFCRNGKFLDSIDALYSDDIVSVEAMAPPGGEQTMTGKEAVRGKNTWWIENHEIHSMEVEGPYPHGDRFAVRFKFDVTDKPSGQRQVLDEVGLFTVAGGEVVREEFFYGAE